MLESTMGISRRFLNLIVNNHIPGMRSLCCIDLNRQKFFHPLPSSTVGAGSESVVAAGLSTTQTPASDASNPTSKQAKAAASTMGKFRLREPTLFFKAEGVPDRWYISCFPLGDGKVICADQSGRTFLLDANASPHQMETMPSMHNPRWMQISLYAPNAGGDADQGSSSKFYIMESVPEPEAGCSTLPSDQFEAFVYRRTTDSWHSELIPPPPFVRDPTYWQSRQKIESYAVVSGGSHICLSTKEAGTYCLDTAHNSWSKVGEWKLPFKGKVEYVPELKLWFGFAAESGHLAAADLSTIFTMDSQPQLLSEWKEFEPPEGWVEVQDSRLVNLGSGRLCIARFFQSMVNHIDFGKGYVVLTCVEVKAAHDGNCSASDNGKVKLGITRFKPRYLMSDINIDDVF